MLGVQYEFVALTTVSAQCPLTTPRLALTKKFSVDSRLGPGRYKVGARIGDVGIVGVMEGRQPMIRFLASKPDALGRSVGNQI